MRTTLYTLLILFLSCNDTYCIEECKNVERVVRNKKEGIRTTYDAIKGIPNTHSYYVILFEDGHTLDVDLGNFMKYEIGKSYSLKDCKRKLIN